MFLLPILELLIIFFLMAAAPVVVWASIQLLRPIPPGPFLALTPATTGLGRSLTVAPMLAAALGLAILAALSFAAWVVFPAIVLIAFVGIGCSRAFITVWWPATLAVSLLLLGYGFIWLQRLGPWWAASLVPGSLPARALVIGAAAIFASSLWSTAVALMATSDA